MKSEAELKKARDETLRKIGRNMLLYQSLEHLLKYINTNSKFSGYESDIKSNQAKKSEAIHKQTMGQLVGEFLEDVDSEDESENETAELHENHLSFQFSVHSKKASHFESKKHVLGVMVSDRNELIHHLLPNFNPESIKSCVETSKYLDLQREKILPEIKELKNIIKAIQNGKKILLEFFNSDEGARQFERLFLRHSPLVILLGEIATQTARPDGWAYLSSAGKLCHQRASEEIIALKERYGYKKLKDLILATELFYIREETTDKGGVRILYQLKANCELKTT